MREFWDSHVDMSSEEITPEQGAILRHCGDVTGLAVL